MNGCPRDGGGRDTTACNRETCECMATKAEPVSGPAASLASIKTEGERVAYDGPAQRRERKPFDDLLRYLRDDVKRGHYFEINPDDGAVLLAEIDRLRAVEREHVNPPLALGPWDVAGSAYPRCSGDDIHALRACVSALLPYANGDPQSAVARAVYGVALEILAATESVDA